MRSTLHLRHLAGLLAAVTSALALSGCASELTRTGSSPAFIIIDSILGASGAEPDTFGSPLSSDVRTAGGTFNDLAEVTMRVGLKNPGTVTSPTAPSPNQSITLNRYRVTYRRADGRNVQGVDVPFGFDGAITVTVPVDGIVTFGIEVVRNQAKWESPLSNLVGLGGGFLISTLAEIEFYGRDQVGNEVIARGSLQVNFGDFADPTSTQ